MDKIAVMMSPNEKSSDRAKDLALAIGEDIRFELPIFEDISVDLRFVGEPHHHGYDLMGDVYSENIFNVELKLPPDYIQSTFGKDGHLFEQCLSMREEGHPCMVVVIGNDMDVSRAVKESLQTRYRGQELAFQIASYEDRLRDFEANALAIGIPVMRWPNPHKRLLSVAHKILMGGSLMGYKPRPCEGERDLVAASLLFKGIGAKTLEPVMAEYDLAFVPKTKRARPICEFAGIGKKRSEMIEKRVRMIYQ